MNSTVPAIESQITIEQWLLPGAAKVKEIRVNRNNIQRNFGG